MDVINDDANSGFRRVEVLSGPVRRRHWSTEVKGRIVAESLAGGVTVTEVARRWQVCPQQLWGWRRAARAGELVLPASQVPGFVPVVVETPPSVADVPNPTPRDQAGISREIEITLAGAVLRVAAGTELAHLSMVLRAVRASVT